MGRLKTGLVWLLKESTPDVNLCEHFPTGLKLDFIPAELTGGDKGEFGLLGLTGETVRIRWHPQVVLILVLMVRLVDDWEGEVLRKGNNLTATQRWSVNHLVNGDVGWGCRELVAPVHLSSPAAQTIIFRWCSNWHYHGWMLMATCRMCALWYLQRGRSYT